MKGEWLWQGGLLFALIFLLTVCLERRLIPRLREKASQPILEIGPAWHLSKAGTPTLGGIGFILAMLIVICAWSPLAYFVGNSAWQKLLFLLLFSLCCGLIGLFDDWCKLSKKQNKGLSAWQKYLLQLLLSVAFLCVAKSFFGLSTAVTIPFLGAKWEMGAWYYPFAVLYLTGMINALNLTDGVDGLLSSLICVFSGFLVLLGLSVGEGVAFFTGASLLAAALGFLCFNAHPAKIFMGDTGSLFLGGIVAGYGILSASPLAILFSCGVFVIEAFSVILQVVWFKLSKGKRLFRMSPLHHHFEKGGWSEMRVVAVFCLWALVFAAGGFLLWRV